MKNLVFIIIFYVIFSYSLNAQVVTPNGSQVTQGVTSPNDNDWTVQERAGMDASYLVPGREILYDVSNPSSTYTYNCHGYAWHMTGLGGLSDRKWIVPQLPWLEPGDNSITNDFSLFWRDGSYTQVSREIHPGKVLYLSGGSSGGSIKHSANTTDVPGVYKSKWGRGPLIKHSKNDYEETFSSLKYYVKTGDVGTSVLNSKLFIDGPGTISSQTTYTLDIISDQGFVWELSSPSNGFIIQNVNSPSQSIISVKVTPPNGYNQSVTLKAVKKDSGEATLAVITKNISTPSPPPTIDGPATVCSTGTFSISTGQSASWSVTSGFSVSPSTGVSTTVTASAQNGQNGTVTAVVNGTSITKSIQACNLSISGPDKICTTATYTINGGQALSWQVQPTGMCTILSSSATSITVSANFTYEAHGVIAAYLTSGVGIAKPVTISCSKSNINGSLRVIPSGEGLANVPVEVSQIKNGTLWSTGRKVASGKTDKNCVFNLKGTIDQSFVTTYLDVSIPYQKNYINVSIEERFWNPNYATLDLSKLDFVFYNRESCYITTSQNARDTIRQVVTAADVYTKIWLWKRINGELILESVDSLICKQNVNNLFNLYY